MTEETNTRADELRAEAAQHDQDAADSFERSDTDGFVSQWASGINARKARREADIEEAGGIATFGVLKLYTLGGEPVPTKVINGKFGLCHALLDADGDFTGDFVGANPARESTLAKKGYREVEEEVVAEAQAAIFATGRGLSGAASAQVVTKPKDPKLNYYRVIGLGDRRGEEA